MKFIILFIVLQISFATLSFPTEAKQRIIFMNIEQETERYKTLYFKGQEDVKGICDHLEDYQRYVDKTVAILMNELINNRVLYNKLFELPAKKNGELILKRNGDLEVNEYITYLLENGLRLGSSEGGLYLFQDPLYFVNSFNKVLPEPIIEYYIILNKDIEEGFAEDGALIIPWDNLREKIIRYESYLKRNISIDCPYIAKLVKKKINKYLRSYLYGAPNGPFLADIDNKNLLNQEAKKSFERFLKENKDSKHFRIIQTFYSKIEENDFRVNEDALRTDQEISNNLKESRAFY